MARTALSFFAAEQRVTDAEVRRLLLGAASTISRDLGRTLKSDSFSTQVRRAQLQIIRGQLRQAEGDLWDDVSRGTQRGIRRATDAAVDAEDWMDRALWKEDPAERGVYLTDRHADARRLAETLIERRTKGRTLSSRVYKARDLDSDRVYRRVANGILAQKSADEIAKDVEKYIKPTTPGGTSYAAHRLARTEMNNAFHEMQKQEMKASPAVIAAKWILSGSHPVPDECNKYAEEDHSDLGVGIFKLGEIPDKPHPNCLCYMTPVQPDRDEFYARLEARKRAREARSARIPG